MATYGKVKAFNPKADDWEVYEEQLRFYMVANNITDAAKKRSILLTVAIRPSSYCEAWSPTASWMQTISPSTHYLDC